MIDQEHLAFDCAPHAAERKWTAVSLATDFR